MSSYYCLHCHGPKPTEGVHDCPETHKAICKLKATVKGIETMMQNPKPRSVATDDISLGRAIKGMWATNDEDVNRNYRK